MVEFNVQYVSMFAIGLCLLGAIGIFIAGGNGPLAVISAIICALGGACATLFYRYGYFVVPLLTSRTNIVQIMEGNYEIPPAQDVILKQVGGLYYASAYLNVRIYESTTDKSPEENVIYSEYFERAISSVRFPVKFAMTVYVKDMSKHRLSLETKHAEAQLRLSREREKPDPDVLKLDRYEKEVGYYEGQLNRLVSGVKPMGAMTYLMTTAIGVSKEGATAAAKTQANELKATVSNALNVEVVSLQGDEMLKCFDWEHIIPPTQEAMEQSIL